MHDPKKKVHDATWKKIQNEINKVQHKVRKKYSVQETTALFSCSYQGFPGISWIADGASWLALAQLASWTSSELAINYVE